MKSGGVFMYRLENVSKRFGGFLALENISFSLPSKGLVAIKGKSGSGKSTLLNLMSLMETPTEGKIFYKGIDTSSLHGGVARHNTVFHRGVFCIYSTAFIGRCIVLQDTV